MPANFDASSRHGDQQVGDRIELGVAFRGDFAAPGLEEDAGVIERRVEGRFQGGRGFLAGRGCDAETVGYLQAQLAESCQHSGPTLLTGDVTGDRDRVAVDGQAGFGDESE